ncbi:Ig-like domain-containing protein [Bifidobacterium scaligerum]|uniref:GH16 domain-containing protein n=1 Tax=Bifidobacterium scaligerum TaxID=2052656 RepID=A0A2M9HPE3_9BIFI|nr:Ig-like domain-containing protein [Bifidobacterium scaligerum]PJM78651.1 hypothetical protein CUU80_07875 [Bifidobacterium scaligerum]
MRRSALIPITALLAFSMVMPVSSIYADESNVGVDNSGIEASPSSCEAADSSAETFHDDFDGDSIDTMKWPSVGSLGGKYYISDAYSSYTAPENVEVNNGNLRLWLRQDGKKNFTWVGKDSPKNSNGWGWKQPYTGKMPAYTDGYPWNDPLPYTAGAVTSNPSGTNGFAQQYGKFSVCQKAPKGKGVWSAFWLLAKSGGWPPEFDIAEFYGGQGDGGQGTMQTGHPWKRNANGTLSWDDSVWSNNSKYHFTDQYYKFTVVLSKNANGVPMTDYYINNQHIKHVQGPHAGQSFDQTEAEAEQGFYFVLNTGAQSKKSWLTPFDYPTDPDVEHSYDIAWVSAEALTETLAPLQRVVNDIHKLDANDYTTDSWNVLSAETSQASKLLGDASTSATTVNETLAKLQTAQAALVKKTPVDSISLSADDMRDGIKYVDKDSSAKIFASVAPSQAAQDWGNPAWSSSDSSVATVDKTGTVTGHKSGTAVISAKVGGKTGTITVQVSEPQDVAAYKQSNGVDLDNAQWKVPTQKGKVFSGWFTEPWKGAQPYTETSGKAYPHFVDGNVLSVKRQISAGTTAQSAETDLRLLTTVDSLDYQSAGFEVALNDGQPSDKQTSTVYTKISANDGTTVVANDPTVFSPDSKYFVTYSYWNIPNDKFATKFSVTPYWITLDGTRVEGVNRVFTVSDAIQ